MFKLKNNCPQQYDTTCSIDLKAILQNIEDFKDLKPKTFDEILNISHIQEYKKDTIIYYENEIVNNISYLFHGFIKVYKINKFDNEVVMNIYRNNCVKEGTTPLINYHALIRNTSYYNVICVESCKILNINAESFKEIIKYDTALSANMLKTANKIIQDQEYTINLGMIYDAKSKLASLLYYNPDIFSILNKKYVSQMLNISQETLSRNIQKLKDDNIIGTSNKKIIILDKEKLHAIFKV